MVDNVALTACTLNHIFAAVAIQIVLSLQIIGKDLLARNVRRQQIHSLSTRFACHFIFPIVSLDPPLRKLNSQYTALEIFFSSNSFLNIDEL